VVLGADVELLAVHTVVDTEEVEAADSLRTRVKTVVQGGR
jgi:hypothetical protein